MSRETTDPKACGGRPGASAPVGRRQTLWSLLFLLIAAASVWAITSQVRGFSFEGFMDSVQEASVLWLALAVACMLLHVFFEGAAVLQICKTFGHSRRAIDGFAYASADIYFSAITPSATGGQPASAYFMMRDGIPGPVATVALLVNLIMYTLSIVFIGAFCFIARPGVFALFSPLAQGMILAGCAVQLGLAMLFLLLLREHRLLHRVCDAALRLLERLHLLRRPQAKRERLRKAIEEYREHVHMMAGQRRVLVRAFLLNLMQRVSLIAVTMCTFRALGGAGARMLDAWAVQGFSVLGYNFVPIPGAVGVADLMLLDGFGQLMSEQSAAHLELLSRTLSFYSCILICGATVLLKYLIARVRKDNR